MSSPSAQRSTGALSFARRMSALRPSAIREILKTTEAPEVISFAGGLPAPELFPVEAIRAATDAVLSANGPAALQYGLTEGWPALRGWVAAHLAATVGLSVSEENTLITQGSQQGLDLLGKVLLDPGDTVLVENPAYLGALQAFQAYEANLVGLASDDEGLRADALDDFLRRASARAKFLYLIPNYQNPTGRSMSMARRAEIAAIATRAGLLVVEDDPYGRLRFEGEARPALGALAPAGPWVYLGSVSKILAPGLRVGWLATSESELRAKLATAKQASDLHTGSLTQRIVHQLLSTPDFLDGHVAKLCTSYRERRDVMLAALHSELHAHATWTRPAGGLFLWVTLREAHDTVALLRAAMKQQVAFVPGAPFWVGEAPPNTLRLNFSNSAPARIREGISRLGRVVNATTEAHGGRAPLAN